MKFATKLLHAGIHPDKATGAIMTPIYQTSTYVQSAPGEHHGYSYSRSHNPTRTPLEQNLAALENAKHGFVFGSGMAACEVLIKMLDPGDHVISTNDLYGGAYRMFTTVFKRLGIEFTFVDMTRPEEVSKAIKDNTRMIWAESPTNPALKIVDIAEVATISKKHNLIMVVDNTFASPYLQNPIDLGADVVMHSVTKYINGHSDVVMGAVICNDDTIADRVAYLQNSCGAVPGPQDCFLALRGIKTLAVRMRQHCENGRSVAHFLNEHTKVGKVNWPGFESHPGHEIAARQMRDFGGMISFSLANDSIENAVKVLSATKIFSLAESLGGVESLIGHPATMTHASIPREERMKAGLSDSLIRLSVGIEDVDDLLADLDQALNQIP
jgi:cystathionine beta-lyase